MNKRIISTILLILFLTGCLPPGLPALPSFGYPTAPPTPPIRTTSPSPAPSDWVEETEILTQTEPAPLRTPTLLCETDTARIEIRAPAETVKVDDPLPVTLTLFNEGCVALGLPQYSLAILHTETGGILEPRRPAPVVHSLAVQPGSADRITFNLRASGPGKAILRAMVSYEVHLGYPGPAYWGIASSKELVILVEK